MAAKPSVKVFCLHSFPKNVTPPLSKCLAFGFNPSVQQKVKPNPVNSSNSLENQRKIKSQINFK